MSECVMSWVVLIALLLLVTLVVMAGMALCRLADVRELWERLRAQLAANEGHLNKVETAVDWFLQKEGMKVDFMHATWKWYVTSIDDGHLRDWLDRKDDRKREELADSIYRAYLQAMRDRDKERAKETKKK